MRGILDLIHNIKQPGKPGLAGNDSSVLQTDCQTLLRRYQTRPARLAAGQGVPSWFDARSFLPLELLLGD
jgi:hypothetical protein